MDTTVNLYLLKISGDSGDYFNAYLTGIEVD